MPASAASHGCGPNGTAPSRVLREQLVAEGVEPRDPCRRGHARVVGEGDVDPGAARRGARRSTTRRVRARSGRRPAVLVFTWVSWWTSRNFEASAVTSSVDTIHEPTASSSTSWVASATSRSRQRGHRPHARGGAPSTTSTAAGPALSLGAGRRASSSACARSAKLACDVLAQLVGVVGQPQQVEVGHRAGVQAGVAHRQAVGDDRRAGRPGLQAGDPAGGVHEHVGRRQQLGHPVGEAVDVHPRFGGEDSRAASRRAARCGRQGRRCCSPRRRG